MSKLPRNSHRRLDSIENNLIPKILLSYVVVLVIFVVSVILSDLLYDKENSAVEKQYAQVYAPSEETPKAWLDPEKATFGEFILALMMVEGGFNPDNSFEPSSTGPLQITEAYWTDANLAYPYRYAWDVSSSMRVAYAYFKRYQPNALEKNDWETLARLHNGGPSMKNTDDYWKKVQEAMEIVIDLR